MTRLIANLYCFVKVKPMAFSPKILRSFGIRMSGLGILCYSAQIDDPVIWSHYADCHRGMALGFELPPDELFKVQYPVDDARAQLDYDKLERLVRLDNDQALMKVIAEGFTRKANSWKYEEEYRQFIFLRGCTMIGPHYFRGMPLQHLRRIVLGVNSRITVADIFRIKRQWNEKLFC
jgi:hypothetical protein